MNRKEMAAKLRRAADALEGGHDFGDGFVVITPDDVEFTTKEDAERWAAEAIEPDGEWPENIGCVQWGLFVPFERASVNVLTDPDSVETAKAYGFDEVWEVSLVEAWAAPPADALCAEAEGGR